jgi:hypothetical protein
MVIPCIHYCMIIGSEPPWGVLSTPPAGMAKGKMTRPSFHTKAGVEASLVADVEIRSARSQITPDGK